MSTGHSVAEAMHLAAAKAHGDAITAAAAAAAPPPHEEEHESIDEEPSVTFDIGRIASAAQLRTVAASINPLKKISLGAWNWDGMLMGKIESTLKEHALRARAEFEERKKLLLDISGVLTASAFETLVPMPLRSMAARERTRITGAIAAPQPNLSLLSQAMKGAIRKLVDGVTATSMEGVNLASVKTQVAVKFKEAMAAIASTTIPPMMYDEYEEARAQKRAEAKAAREAKKAAKEAEAAAAAAGKTGDDTIDMTVDGDEHDDDDHTKTSTPTKKAPSSKRTSSAAAIPALAKAASSSRGDFPAAAAEGSAAAAAAAAAAPPPKSRKRARTVTAENGV